MHRHEGSAWPLQCRARRTHRAGTVILSPATPSRTGRAAWFSVLWRGGSFHRMPHRRARRHTYIDYKTRCARSPIHVHRYTHIHTRTCMLDFAPPVHAISSPSTHLPHWAKMTTPSPLTTPPHSKVLICNCAIEEASRAQMQRRQPIFPLNVHPFASLCTAQGSSCASRRCCSAVGTSEPRRMHNHPDP